jgi:hypothetical protein
MSRMQSISECSLVPIVRVLKMVPTTAMRRIVPRWSKNSLQQNTQVISRQTSNSTYQESVIVRRKKLKILNDGTILWSHTVKKRTKVHSKYSVYRRKVLDQNAESWFFFSMYFHCEFGSASAPHPDRNPSEVQICKLLYPAIYRVAAIFPERFQCFTVALKNNLCY